MVYPQCVVLLTGTNRAAQAARQRQLPPLPLSREPTHRPHLHQDERESAHVCVCVCVQCMCVAGHGDRQEPCSLSNQSLISRMEWTTYKSTSTSTTRLNGQLARAKTITFEKRRPHGTATGGASRDQAEAGGGAPERRSSCRARSADPAGRVRRASSGGRRLFFSLAP